MGHGRARPVPHSSRETFKALLWISNAKRAAAVPDGVDQCRRCDALVRHWDLRPLFSSHKKPFIWPGAGGVRVTAPPEGSSFRRLSAAKLRTARGGAVFKNGLNKKKRPGFEGLVVDPAMLSLGGHKQIYPLLLSLSTLVTICNEKSYCLHRRLQHVLRLEIKTMGAVIYG
jgi:hypothetical protein